MAKISWAGVRDVLQTWAAFGCLYVAVASPLHWWPFEAESPRHTGAVATSAAVHTGWLWTFLALGLALLATSWISLWKSRRTKWRTACVLVTNKRFINERVPLDGREYSHCDFNNVTFSYNGISPFRFHDNRISGRIQFSSENPAVLTTFGILDGLGGLPPDFDLRSDSSMRMERAKVISPPDRRSSAEAQFRLEMRKFVLSRLQAAVNGYFGVFHELLNRYDWQSTTKTMGDNQWKTIRSLAEGAASDSMSVHFDNLKRLFSASDGDTDAQAEAICDFLVVYARAKDYLGHLPRATGLCYNDENFRTWRAAETSCVESLQDLKASPLGGCLKQAQENFFRREA